MIGVCVARRGPGAGLNSAGPRNGVWMKVVVPTGWRNASGLVATVHRVGGVRGLGRKPVVKLLVSCFCKASLVWRKQEGEWQEVREEHSEDRTRLLDKHVSQSHGPFSTQSCSRVVHVLTNRPGFLMA